MLRLEGLDHRPTGAIAPSCPTHHLGKHIEGGLPCPEAPGIEAQVSVQHANQCHIRQIQSLGNHLGSQKHGNVFLLKMLQNFLMGIHRTDRIRVHPAGFHIRKQGSQFLLHLLGAGTDGFQGPAAGGTPGRRGHGKAAVVAHQAAVGTVIGQVNAASGTLRRLAAVDAHQSPAVAPAVQQQNGLLSGLTGL